MQAVEIRTSGMVTSVGLSSAASCAAIRAGIARFQETPFLLGEEPIYGSAVPLQEPLRGREKLLRMATMTLQECLEGVEEVLLDELPILLCLPEMSRPGRIEGLDEGFLSELRRSAGLGASGNGSCVLALGRVGGAQGVAEAVRLFGAGREACVVIGVDSYLTGATLTAYNDRDRLKTESNSDGFIPGEAAAAVLLRRSEAGVGGLRCIGLGMGTEPAPIESEEPLRAEGLVQAIKGALRSSQCTFGELDYRIIDVNGEHYAFKEATLALNRTLREQKKSFTIWHPADCIGDVGAATGPVVLALALAAARKGYAPGPGVLCHFSSDGSERAALILRNG